MLQDILRHLQENGRIEFTPTGVLWIWAERKELDALIKRGKEI